MSKQLNRDEAWELLTEYNQDPFHLHHARTVEGVMRYFAQELGYGDEVDFWGIVGLLHDLDFERYPDQHCIKYHIFDILPRFCLLYTSDAADD